MNNYHGLTKKNKCLYGGDAAFCYREELDNKYLDYNTSKNNLFKLPSKNLFVRSSALIETRRKSEMAK